MDGKILVLDDEPGITLLCNRLLRRAGYDVVSFTEPDLAIAHLEKDPVDLLLVDIRMPHIDGFEVITRAKHYQPDIAVLVMTGFGTVETAIQALRQGVDGLLLKPFEQGDELVETVKQAFVDSERKRDAARIQTLRPLFTLSEALLSETRSDRLLKLIIASVREHLGCEHAACYQFDQEAGGFRLLAGEGSYFEPGSTGHDAELLMKIHETGTPVLVNSLGPGEPHLKRAIQERGLAAVLIVDVAQLNRATVFFAGRASENAQFREADLEMFLILANQATVALENARLYDELREYVRQVEESQQALVQAEKMAAAGRLTASIAHEVNNPLQALQNCVHLAGREDLTEEQRAEYFELAKTELDRLMATVQRMLDFYRPGMVKSTAVNLKELFEHVLGLLSQQLEKHGVDLCVNIPDDLPVVPAVSNQIQQVFINLILNALDAMPDGGRLLISARGVPGGVEFLFSDSGPGIPNDHVVHIFEPFFSTKVGGTGLGLTVSYNILTAHGGALELVSDTDQGASFRMFLPMGEY